jgi:hypothetical protein
MSSTLPKEVEVKERQTTRITGVLYDDAGDPVPGSTLTTLTLTVYDNDIDKTVIVSARNILNANNGVVDEAGQVMVLLAPADMPIRTATLPFERHTCLFQWTWGTAPEKAGAEELVLVVRNLAKVPS